MANSDNTRSAILTCKKKRVVWHASLLACMGPTTKLSLDKGESTQLPKQCTPSKNLTLAGEKHNLVFAGQVIVLYVRSGG